MIIYKDLISGDEIASDSYPRKAFDTKEFNDVAIQFIGKFKTECDKIDDALLGANASAESGAEGTEETSKSGIDVVLANRLMEYPFSNKKEFGSYMKKHLKNLLEKKEMSPEVKTSLQKFVKSVMDEFDEYSFYKGESMDENGTPVMVKWVGETPYVIVLKHALEEEKM